MGIERRKRRQDGTFGEPEKVFSGQTDKEKLEESMQETEVLQLALVDLHGRVITIYGDIEEDSITSQMAIIDLHQRIMEALDLRDKKIDELKSKLEEMEVVE